MSYHSQKQKTKRNKKDERISVPGEAVRGEPVTPDNFSSITARGHAHQERGVAA